MADIKIENIDLSGLELFSDPEGFLSELDDSDESSIIGGLLANDDIYTNAASCCCAGSCTCPALNLKAQEMELNAQIVKL